MYGFTCFKTLVSLGFALAYIDATFTLLMGSHKQMLAKEFKLIGQRSCDILMQCTHADDAML